MLFVVVNFIDINYIEWVFFFFSFSTMHLITQGYYVTPSVLLIVMEEEVGEQRQGDLKTSICWFSLV